MIHSFLIVGGTVKKRKLETQVVVAQFTARPEKFDTMALEPEEGKQTISIDQIRDLQHQLSLKPYASKYKTGIILSAQRMTVSAQNALLKTLEEPPAHSILILTAPSTKSLLPTLASRCQIVRLPPEIDLDLESEEHREAVEEFSRLLRLGRGERLAWAEANNSKLKNQNSNLCLLDVWISVLRDLLLINAGCQNLILNSFKPFKPFKPQVLTESLDLTIKTKRLIATTNVNPRLALEILLLDLPVFQP